MVLRQSYRFSQHVLPTALLDLIGHGVSLLCRKRSLRLTINALAIMP